MNELKHIWVVINFILLILIILLINAVLSSAYFAPQSTEANEIPKDGISYQIDFCGLADVKCDNEKMATVYAYNSEVGQTDDTPCITASGYNPCIGTKKIVANNCLEFGTKVIIQGVEYEVQDRMNARYSCSDFDIWHENYQDAKNWGVKTLEITY